jgi:hypothetical protein
MTPQATEASRTVLPRSTMSSSLCLTERVLAAARANRTRLLLSRPCFRGGVADAAGDRSLVDAAATIDHIQQLALDPAWVRAVGKLRPRDVFFDDGASEYRNAAHLQPEQRLDAGVLQPVHDSSEALISGQSHDLRHEHDPLGQGFDLVTDKRSDLAVRMKVSIGRQLLDGKDGGAEDLRGARIFDGVRVALDRTESVFVSRCERTRGRGRHLSLHRREPPYGGSFQARRKSSGNRP